ncbi:MAG: ATP-binding protein [Defluviitaleaceae bacterium]|nr:ATP-binding protein [Defluviitaleaceae bacterium]
MLINFEVTNFRSFKETATFSMEAATKGTGSMQFNSTNTMKVGKHKLLKSAVVFGANASGKSNLMKAVYALYLIVTNSTKDSTEKIFTNTFAFNNENTKFTIQFIKNRKHFFYTLEYNEDEVVFEELLIDEKFFLGRKAQQFSIPEQLEQFKKSIRKNQLLLFVAQSFNIEEAMEAFSWFKQDLFFLNDSGKSNPLFEALKDYSFKNKFLAILKEADFNIIDVEIIEKPLAPINIIIGDIVASEDSIIVSHIRDNGEIFKIRFDDESRGTKVFAMIVFYLIMSSKDIGKIILIDEFNSSFHLALALQILDLIHREKQNNQFILTTHETSLMDYGLRQDQIYFTEKNEFGETEIFSLFDFDDPLLMSKNPKYKKNYLIGRFGAVPSLDPFTLKRILEGDDE